MLRVDREDRGPGDGAALLAAFKARLAAADVVVLSDYAKGVLTPRSCAGRSTRPGRPASR
jgi:D-beta-D-heptose 7-phosphate kinase/D-beta-D-heptose 1-phosphate adenosyltransferase